MKFSRACVRFAVACSILAFSPIFLPALASAGEGSSNSDRLLFWLLGIHIAREEGRLAKIDVNSATVGQLETVPGISRRHAVRIAAQRPYATLSDLARAGLSPYVIERLAAFLSVDPEWPSAMSGRQTVAPAR